jgi:hypothetical protein
MDSVPRVSFHPFFNMKCWFSACLMLVSLHSVASAVDINQQIYLLLEQQDYQQAFDLATVHQDDYEGETEFDLAYGLAAGASNHCNLAVFALERVLAIQPQLHSGRLALANCYAQLGNLSAAQQEYSLLLTQTLNEPMKAAVALALANVEKAQRAQKAGWHGSAQLATGFDDNPNNGIEDEFITVPLLGQVRLFEQSRAVSSAYYDFNAQLSYIAPLTQTSRWYSALAISYTGYTEELALSKSNLNAQLGYQGTWFDNDIGARLFYRPLQLDGEGFLDYSGISFDISHAFMAKSALGAELTLAQLDYASYDELSRDQALFSVWLATPTFGATSRFSLKVGQENVDSSLYEFNSRDLLGVSYALQKQLSALWSYGISAEYLRAQYAADHPLFATTREDKLLQFVLDLHYQWQTNWQFSGQLSVTDNRSNLNLFDYKRSNVWIGARYQF